MGLKVIKDFQQGDSVVVRLEFAGPINLTGNSFNITLASKAGLTTPEYDHNYVANTNGYTGDDLSGGIINLVIETAGLTAGNYLYSITRTDSAGYVTTIARSGLNSVDTVECKPQL